MILEREIGIDWPDEPKIGIGIDLPNDSRK
jgi:hypothetical protein